MRFHIANVPFSLCPLRCFAYGFSLCSIQKMLPVCIFELGMKDSKKPKLANASYSTYYSLTSFIVLSPVSLRWASQTK